MDPNVINDSDSESEDDLLGAKSCIMKLRKYFDKNKEQNKSFEEAKEKLSQ